MKPEGGAWKSFLVAVKAQMRPATRSRLTLGLKAWVFLLFPGLESNGRGRSLGRSLLRGPSNDLRYRVVKTAGKHNHTFAAHVGVLGQPRKGRCFFPVAFEPFPASTPVNSIQAQSPHRAAFQTLEAALPSFVKTGLLTQLHWVVPQIRLCNQTA